ncbi:hypothetical protein [Phyllobacterium endophyticum]|uniref:hypothetical protein n=1 Tax=Phyllobacterium endophyticum TaxID=1149773 RepID=UPI0011CA6393|nr:hypothetical protein [Phyllobacterium endophyticum]TXR49884.1 hypothetical protein FVA77_07680 [Phyllobacterium endophyticum]
MAKASLENLELLHNAVVKALADRIADGTASASDLAVAAKMLKDNGISRLLDAGVNELGRQVEGAIPDPEAEMEEYDNVVGLYR